MCGVSFLCVTLGEGASRDFGHKGEPILVRVCGVTWQLFVIESIGIRMLGCLVVCL